MDVCTSVVVADLLLMLLGESSVPHSRLHRLFATLVAALGHPCVYPNTAAALGFHVDDAPQLGVAKGQNLNARLSRATQRNDLNELEALTSIGAEPIATLARLRSDLEADPVRAWRTLESGVDSSDWPAERWDLAAVGDTPTRPVSWASQWKMADDLVALALERVPLGRDEIARLLRLARSTMPFRTRLVLCLVAAEQALEAGLDSWALGAGALGARAYEPLTAHATRCAEAAPSRLRQAFASVCQSILDRHGLAAVPAPRAPARVLRLYRERPRRRPRRGNVLRTLDALIAASEGKDRRAIDRQIGIALARFLGARVLLHYDSGRWLKKEAQAQHTLDMWSIRKLATERRLVRRRVRACPEFWRPEQRRPRGLLSIPLGSGTICLARTRPFEKSESRAIRTLLRFVEGRRKQLGRTPPTAPSFTRRRRAVARPIRGLVGSSQPWQEVLEHIWRLRQASCPVIVTGETGTGKEEVARAIHLVSPRTDKPFVPINCGALQGELMQSQLFGHVRGAFTGAHRDQDGVFVQAHEGTLFLDEIGEMPSAVQIALLRALQDGHVQPLGSTRARRVDARIVAATHRDIDARVDTGFFRADLLHRIDVVRIHLPPLRHRLDDLPALSEHLLRRAGVNKAPTPQALSELTAYDWPGNVRELANVLQAAAVLTDEPQISRQAVSHALELRRRRRQATREVVHIASPPARSQPIPSPEHHASRSSRLLGLLQERWWRAPELARRLGVSTRTINRDLGSLIEEGVVIYDGAARARRYHAASRQEPDTLT